jgi:hypothetical protein
MSSIPVKTFCPLGSKCEEVKDGAIHRCAWYIEVHGRNPNTGDVVKDWACSMAWLPMLTIENSQQQRSTGAAIESFRNETVKANEMSQQILLATVREVHPDIRVIEAPQ